jgi:phenylpropionate dioxygenase-like ring-hydroxylating dioxygenase large terminal subunit
MNAQDDKAVWNAWYPVGSPVDLRRQKRTRTHLLDRELTLTLHPTRITAECDRRALPVVERLGYVWTTLGKPEKLPQPLIEYYEVDRLTLNIWSTPLKCSGLRIIDNVIDNAHFPFVPPGILGDEAHLELPPYENSVDEEGTLWSKSHRAYLPISGAIAEYTYRISDPYSVILFIHRQRAEGEVQRYDYLGVFAQPTTEISFVAHKMFAWVREDWMDERRLRSDQQWISVQDKYVLEKHNPKKLPIDERIEASVSVDSASIAYRRWLQEKAVQYGVSREDAATAGKG